MQKIKHEKFLKEKAHMHKMEVYEKQQQHS